MRFFTNTVLNENINTQLKIRRRLHQIDESVKTAVRDVELKHSTICFGEQEFFETVTEEAVNLMYWNYFSNINDDSIEWYNIYKTLVSYIENRFIFSIKEHYHIRCGD